MSSPPPVITSPIVAAVCRHPRRLAGCAALLVAVCLLGTCGGMTWSELDPPLRKCGTERVFAFLIGIPGSIVGVSLLIRALRALLGFGPSGMPLWILGATLRFGRSVKVALRLRWPEPGGVILRGRIREWEDERGPFLLATVQGNVWVEADLRYTVFATRSLPRVGDEVDVIGANRQAYDEGIYRGGAPRMITAQRDAPLVIATPGSRPAAWIAGDAAVSLLAATLHVLALLPAFLV